MASDDVPLTRMLLLILSLTYGGSCMPAVSCLLKSYPAAGPQFFHFWKTHKHKHKHKLTLCLSQKTAGHCGGVSLNVETMGRRFHASCKMCAFMINTLHRTFSKAEQSGAHFLVHLIQHNLNFSAAKPNWPCSFTYMSLYTHAMYFVACMYEYETYGFIHDMLDLWLRHSY